MLASSDNQASNNGGDHPKQLYPPRDPKSSPPITLKFLDVSYRVKLHESNAKSRACSIRDIFGGGAAPPSDVESQAAVRRHHHQERTILNGISGKAAPGRLLAILGPSGSGKSTLLNALSGRLHQGNGLTGTVHFNNRKITKQILKKTGFVTQDDVLYPHLTVRETLFFCSLLRLPKSTPKSEKIAVVESVISELGLTKCADTIIGNAFIRGVSGGERKRVSIAHEMLVDPSLLILDEPTSGLDATAAYRLVATLGGLAAKGKTVVTSVHQPSSRAYQMFDDLLVLAEGRCVYFGRRSEVMGYFESVGFSPSFAMNPADFLLDLANGVCPMDGSTERERPNVRQTLVTSYNNVLAPRVKLLLMDSSNAGVIVENPTTKHFDCTSHLSSWFNQFSILIQRNLKERKHETFNSLRVFQVITASLLAGFMWWHSDYRDIQDRLGLLFFISIFWGVFPSFNAVFAFPQERAIFMKERASGMYTLSSYFMARITGDLPMELILPTLFLSITYWMTGLKPEIPAFVLTLIVLLGYVLVSQGLGLALSALIMDAKQASTVVTVTMLAFVLTGGYYVHKVPAFVGWIKYVSTTFYSYRLLINVQYGEGKAISSMLGCSSGGHDRGHDRATCKFIDEDICGQIHPAMSVGILMIMFVGYRVLAYIALRRIRA